MDPEVLNFAQVMGILVPSIAVLAVVVVASVRMLRPPAKEIRRPIADPRLEKLEQAVDAIAIEVERIAEGQRFVTKILAERAALPEPRPAVERVVTPH